MEIGLQRTSVAVDKAARLTVERGQAYPPRNGDCTAARHMKLSLHWSRTLKVDSPQQLRGAGFLFGVSDPFGDSVAQAIE